MVTRREKTKENESTSGVGVASDEFSSDASEKHKHLLEVATNAKSRHIIIGNHQTPPFVTMTLCQLHS